MITNKIKSTLALYSLNFADYARALNIYPQALNNKAKKETYKISDLITLAELTNTKLVLINNDNDIVTTFNAQDLEEKQ